LLFGFGLGVLILSYFAGEQLYDYQDTLPMERLTEGPAGSPLPPIDVIVCLAGGRGRIKTAAEIWYAYFKAARREGRKTPTLFVSGVDGAADWQTFAAQVPREILEVLPRDRVILEKKSTNTRENAEKFVDFLKARSQVESAPVWKTMVLVTATYHMKRAAHLFRAELNHEGLERFRIETSSVSLPPYVSEEWKTSPMGVQVTLFEFFKWVVVRALG
jgi:uncharacterized SAM-binding protein YcdF (DUF218 family)